MNLVSLSVSFMAFIVWFFSSHSYVNNEKKLSKQVENSGTSTGVASANNTEVETNAVVAKVMSRDEIQKFQNNTRYLAGEYMFTADSDPTPYRYDIQILLYAVPEGGLEEAGYFADIFVTYNTGTKVSVGYRGKVDLKSNEHFNITNVSPMSYEYGDKYGKNIINAWNSIRNDLPENLEIKMNKKRDWEINQQSSWFKIKALLTTVNPDYKKFYGTWTGKIGEMTAKIIIENSNKQFPTATLRWSGGEMAQPCKNTSLMMRLMKDSKLGFFGGEQISYNESWSGCRHAFALGMVSDENKMQILDYTYSDEGVKGELTRE